MLICSLIGQGSLYATHFGEIKQHKSMAILRDFRFPMNNNIFMHSFGLVSYNDPLVGRNFPMIPMIWSPRACAGTEALMELMGPGS